MAQARRLGHGRGGRLAESEALAAIAAAASSTLDIREGLRRVARELVQVLGADTAAAYVVEGTTTHLVPMAAYHVPKEYLPTLTVATLPLREQGFYLPLWRERRAVYSANVATDPRFTHELFRAFPHQSGLILPLILDDEVVGAFYVVWWTARHRFSPWELQLLERVTGQIGLLLRNARLYEQVQRNQHRLEVLNEVSRRLAAVHEQEEVLSLIVNEAARLLAAEAAGMRLFDGDELVVGARTDSAAALMVRPRIKPHESLTGRVVSSGEPVIVEDLEQDTTFDPAHKRGAIEHGFHGFVGVPLTSRGQILGTLNIYTKGSRHFLPDDVALLTGLADQAATAIEKARLFRESRESQWLLEQLYRATIAMQTSWERDDRLGTFVRAAREVVGFDRVNVFLLTPDGASLALVTADGDSSVPAVSLALGHGAGPYYQAFVSRRPVVALSDEELASVWPLDRAYLDHPYLKSRRFVVAPLVVGDRVIGVVSADNKPSRRPIRASSVEPFNMLCQNLAMALEEGRLYREARTREEEATKLYQVTRQLATSLDREHVLDVIVAQMLELTGCDASGIYFYDRDRDGLTFRRGLNLDPELTHPLVLRLGEGIGGRAFTERRPVWTRDRLADPSLQYAGEMSLIEAKAPRAYLAVPIVGRDEAHGVLIEYFFDAHDFTTREIEQVSTLADHAALALESARLFDETRAHQSRLAQIFDSTSDGVVLVSRAGVIEAANRQAGELLGFDADTAVGIGLAEVVAGDRSSWGPEDEPVFSAVRALLNDLDRGGEGDLALRRMGRVVRWIGQPTKDPAGTTIGFTLTLQDVTKERQVAQMKTDFVSFVTHQLRTPLAGIKWMLELAGQEPGVPDEPASNIQDARLAAERLIGLVNDLLDISRLESGKLKVEPQLVSLGALTRSVLGDLVTLVREKGHRITVDDDVTVPPVMADPQLLRQVVLNLTANAIKYTPPGGEVRMRVDVEHGAVRWTVTDSGIGIPKLSQAHLFEKFYRAENAITLETEGTGLGLYLVRLILERFGGRIWCESDEGKGSTFSFTLPVPE
jgi:PAS domain S-box-containing protein